MALTWEQLVALQQQHDLPDLFARPAWQSDAACRETPDVEFFPDNGGDVRPAKAVCARCLVADECRAYAADVGVTDGVWGGVTARNLRRRRAA